MLSILFATILIFSLTLALPALASGNDETPEERATRVAEEKRINKVLEERADLIDKTSRALNKYDDALDSALAGEEALVAAQKKLAKQNESALNVFAEQFVKKEKILEIESGRTVELANQRDALKEFLEDEERVSELTEDQKQKLEENLGLLEDRIDIQKDIIIGLEDEIDILEDQANAVEGITKTWTSGITKITGLGAKWQDSMSGGLAQSIMQADDFSAVLDDIGKSLHNQLAPANLFFSLLDKVAESTIDMAIQADAAYASFNRVTGAGGELDDIVRVRDARERLRRRDVAHRGRRRRAHRHRERHRRRRMASHREGERRRQHAALHGRPT